MYSLSVERGDKLNRQVWLFVLIPETTPLLRLNRYRTEQRVSRRAKWVVTSVYKDSRSPSDDGFLGVGDVPMPEDVVEEARQTFMTHLVITKEVK